MIKKLFLIFLTVGFMLIVPAGAQINKADKSVRLENSDNKTATFQVNQELAVKVTSQEMADQPISSILGGFLFEMGYGDMEGPLRAEMFFNRKFEKFPPYHVDRNYWYQVEDQGKHNLETDWTKKSWYHNGYEHNSWFAAPGSEGPFHIDTTTTFFKESTALANVTIQPLTDAGSDDQFVRISNHETKRMCGLGQQGKWLRKNMTYTFKGSFRLVKGEGKAKILLFPEGNWDSPLVTIPLVISVSQFGTQTFTFSAGNFQGRATFALFISPGSVVDADNFSLMPDDNLMGWRKDAVEAIRQIKPGALRWPGGCFASFYDWKKGILPVDQRRPERSHMWGGWVYHDVGTMEYLNLCELTGSEPFIDINMFSPNKENYLYYDPVDSIFFNEGEHFPQFKDIQAGARLAADWVAYCNAPVTNEWGKLRAEQGHPEPFHVKYWELDNELFRWFNTPEDLAEACVVYSKAMKAVDPTIKLGICSYGDRLSAGLPVMLAIAGKYVDFLADRGPFSSNVQRKVDLLHRYNQENGTAIKYADTEFFIGFDQYGEREIRQFRKEHQERNLDHATWCYALNTLNMLMMWQRFGGDVQFACFNSFVNDHLHSPFEVTRDTTMIKYAGYIYELMNRTQARWPLVLDGYTPGEWNPFQVQASFNDERNKLILYVYNDTPDSRRAKFDLTPLQQKFKTSSLNQLSCPELLMVRTIRQPNEIIKKMETGRIQHGNRVDIEVPPFSFSEIVLE
jgi:alpha-L-arabinofuranosidase